MNQTLTVRSAFGIVLLSILSALVVGTIFGALDPTLSAEAKPGLPTYLAMFVGQGFLLVPVLIFLHLKGQLLLTNLRIHPVPIKILGATALLSLGTIIWTEEINILFSYILPMPESFLQLEEILNPENPIAYILLVATVVILAPVGEEILFRGFLQKFLERTWGDVTRAVLFTSLFFAAIHLNPYWMVQIYMLGVMLGYLAWRSGSVLTSILFHVIVNGSSMLFTARNGQIETFFLWKGHVSPFILVVGGILFWLGFKQLQSEYGGKS